MYCHTTTTRRNGSDLQVFILCNIVSGNWRYRRLNTMEEHKGDRFDWEYLRQRL